MKTNNITTANRTDEAVWVSNNMKQLQKYSYMLNKISDIDYNISRFNTV